MSTFARAHISRTRSIPNQIVTIHRDAVVIKKKHVVVADVAESAAKVLPAHRKTDAGDGKMVDSERKKAEEELVVKRKEMELEKRKMEKRKKEEEDVGMENSGAEVTRTQQVKVLCSTCLAAFTVIGTLQILPRNIRADDFRIHPVFRCLSGTLYARTIRARGRSSS
jgi:hypothetical protein